MQFETLKINNKRSHNIYFTYKKDNFYRSLTLQGNTKECKAKANAWLQWEVSPNRTIKGTWEKTDYLTYCFRETMS